MMRSEEITDNLFAAIDVIVNKRLLDLKRDSTIIAEVVETIDNDHHYYKIKYQNSKFTAISMSNYRYQPKDVVYVQLLNNDISKDKFIIGPVLSMYKAGNFIEEKKEDNVNG